MKEELQTEVLELESEVNYELLQTLDDEVLYEFLDNPLIRKSFEEFLIQCDITEGITEATIEASFIQRLYNNLDGAEVTMSVNIDHLKE